jgi:hypothetical protein
MDDIPGPRHMVPAVTFSDLVRELPGQRRGMTLRLDPELKKALAHAAIEDGVSMTDWITEAIRLRLGASPQHALLAVP